MARQSIVNVIPMDVIWDASYRVLDARRGPYIGRDEVRELLRVGEVLFLVADIGSELLRLSGGKLYAFWREQAAGRLVPPEKAKEGFHREDYPGEYCYLASRWTGPDVSDTIVLFERYH